MSMFTPPAVGCHREPDGSLVLRSRISAGTPTPTILHWLRRFASETPDAVLLTMAAGADRKAWTYAQAWEDVTRVATSLVQDGLRRGDRVLVTGPNSAEHLTMQLAAMLAGAVAVPVAPQYAGPTADRRKLSGLLALVRPSLAWTSDPASAAVVEKMLPGGTLRARVLVGRTAVKELGEAARTDRAGPVPENIDISAPAKILFTSGSTGKPKPVAYTQTMMTTNIQMTVAVWPFLSSHRPVLVDWLPWNHAFGGNANVNLVLSQGGTLHIDEAAGHPDRLDVTIANLSRHRPTFHGAVPAAFAALLPALEADPDFRDAFFGRLDVMFSAGAAMHPDVFRRLSELSATVREKPVPIVTGWGSTEAGPGATMVHALGVGPDCIGTPLPGVEIALRPVADKYELLVRGPCVAAGYWEQPEHSRRAFAADGWYCSGDAGELVDPEVPDRGLRFTGRIADDFKLANGTWVDAGGIRAALLTLGGDRLRDVVVAGADRAAPCVLVWADSRAAEPFGEDDLRVLLDAYNRDNTRPSARLCDGSLLHPEPEGDEVGNKGQLVRGVVLERRRRLIEQLYERRRTQL